MVANLKITRLRDEDAVLLDRIAERQAARRSVSITDTARQLLNERLDELDAHGDPYARIPPSVGVANGGASERHETVDVKTSVKGSRRAS